jgi:hypothetical protein
MELKIKWENHEIPFKNLITSFSFFEDKLFAGIFSGSIFGFNLETKAYNIHLQFKQISLPITYFIIISQNSNEISLISGLKNGNIFYNYARISEKKGIISEKSTLLSEKINEDIIYMNFNENSGALICASATTIHLLLIKINVNFSRYF